MTARPEKSLSPAAPSDREHQLEKQLDPGRLPRHIAIIPDANGRWAKTHGWADRVKGHEAGIQAIRTTIEECARLGIEILSIYAFSRDNWKRSRHETSSLMRFFQKFLIVERPLLEKHNIRLLHSGRREDLPAYVLEALDRTMELTANHTGLQLNLAVSYSGRDEIVRAAQTLAIRVQKGEIQPQDITPERFAHHLYHPELGDPDLLIRTSGENRISDFLLYQMHYAELHFTSILWPDFRRADLLEGIVAYQTRERRFGREEAK
ncbi:di-trans,poly-cis-decaprenylcistransferase [bacterium]|nr:di-trans,poly-cis-decaprenylcistransferase [bacterium]